MTHIGLVYSESEKDRIDREQRQFEADERRRLYYDEMRRLHYGPTPEEIRLEKKERRKILKGIKERHKETEIIVRYKQEMQSRREQRRHGLPDPNSPAEQKLAEQAGRPRASVCEVCGKAGKTVFDHCHEHGHFRGWICNACNAALGMAQDNPATLRRLAEYLEKDAQRLASQTNGATQPIK